MDVFETPFIRAENIIFDVDTRVYEVEDYNQKDDNLKQLEQMVIQDDEKFAQNIITHHSNQSTSADLHPNLIEMTDQFKNLDDSFIFIEFDQRVNEAQMHDLIYYLSSELLIPAGAFQDLKVSNNVVLFRVDKRAIEPSNLIDTILKHQIRIKHQKNLGIVNCDLAIKTNKLKIVEEQQSHLNQESSSISTPILLILIAAPIVFAGMLGMAVCLLKRRAMQRVDDEERLLKSSSDESPTKKRFENLKNFRPSNWTKIIKRSPINGEKTRGGRDSSPTDEYQDLCRQRMEANSDKCSPISSTMCTNMSNINTPGISGINSSTINSTPIRITNEAKNDSDRNSSWAEESSKSFNIDIKTGHVILNFLEKHLMDKNRLNDEWKQLCNYEAEPNECEIGKQAENRPKNRNQDSLPYDHCRVKLKESESDYINASYIIDDDPKNPSYISTQTPLLNTVKDFWHMIWQNDCTTIVTLCNSDEYDSGACVKFWPDSSLQVYGKFEIHLVSVHIWCEDFLIRNFLVKNGDNNQSRAITQFHYLVWPTNGVPTPIKSVLEFRRKVVKSHSNRISPILVQCSDGIGRSGAYILIDMVINKIVRGAKEIDLSATLEYLRDQRAQIVNKKYLYEYAFEAITEEMKQLLEN